MHVSESLSEAGVSGAESSDISSVLLLVHIDALERFLYSLLSRWLGLLTLVFHHSSMAGDRCVRSGA